MANTKFTARYSLFLSDELYELLDVMAGHCTEGDRAMFLRGLIRAAWVQFEQFRGFHPDLPMWTVSRGRSLEANLSWLTWYDPQRIANLENDFRDMKAGKKEA